MYTNIYYNPEELGLEVIGDVDIAGSYEFDILLVVRDKEGNLYYAEDSGCSCPTPFEDTNLESLNPITLKNLEEFERVCKLHKPYCWGYSIEDSVLWHEPSLSLYKTVYDILTNKKED